MSSLPESVLKVGKEIAAYYAGASTSGTPPYIVYVYPPREEYRVRADFNDLCQWLQTRDINAVAISLAELFWQAIDEAGFGEQIVAEEQRKPNDPDTLQIVHVSISQILQQPPSLPERVMAELRGVPERSAAFLYRAGALYPCFRTSALLDDLRERVALPVVLLYPGRLVGQYGLSFMGRCQPAHGYRAMIVAREDQ